MCDKKCTFARKIDFSDMNFAQRILTFSVVALVLTACDYSNFPAGPQEDVYTYDTVNCTGLDIPASAITVREAIAIGKALGSGNTSEEKYYIKGLVKGFHSKHASAMAEFGNAQFYMQDNTNTAIDFYAYQSYGIGGQKFTDINQIAVGDTIVLCGYITNYNGTIETTGKGASFVYFTTNNNAYPEKDVRYFEENFAEGINRWTLHTVANPGMTVWRQNTTSSGVTSAVAQALSGNEMKAGEVWLVSPAINLTARNAQNAKLTFQHYYQKGASNIQNIKQQLRVKVSADGNNWTDMEIPAFNSGSLAKYVPDTLDISAFISSKTQVAFAYTSTAVSAPLWSINQVTVIEHKRSR